MSPWDFDPDRTTRHHAASIAPPVLTIASDFASDSETLSQWRARVSPRRPTTRARLARVLVHTFTTFR